MGTPLSTFPRLLVVLLGLAFATLTATVALSQAPGQKPPPKEEEEDPKPKPKPGVEEEDPNYKPKKTKVIRVGDEGMETTSVAPPITSGAGTDLMTAYRNAKGPALREFFFKIAEPHDIVATNRSSKITVGGVYPPGTFRVRPLGEYLDPDKPRFTGRLTLWLFKDSDWIDDKSWDVQANAIAGILYYEGIVVDWVDVFLKKNGASEENLRAAQMALAAAVSFHDSAREQGKRRGDGFTPLAAAARERLLRVQLDQMNLYVKAEKWDAAVLTASRLADAYTRPEDQARIVGPLADAIKKALETDKATEEQLARLKQIELLFPGTAAAGPVRDKLREKAQGLFDSAKALTKTDPPQALLFAKQAEEMFPRLPELRDFRLGLENKLSELRVGVRELPRYLTPGLAFTDPEKQAVELMFESLIEMAADSEGNPRWKPGLADGTPRTVPLGRQFQIGRDTYWSNDRPVTPEDVRHTVRLLRNPRWPGHNAAWAGLVEEPVGGDPSRVTLTLRQGYLDPLSLMTFKVLPVEPWPNQALLPEEDRKFDQNPVGSGPYRLKQRGGRNQAGREVVSFAANPNYGSRPGKFGLPAIREVQFVATANPVKDLLDKKLDLVIDLPSRDVASVQTIPWLKVRTMPTRRVWFLAVNHRRPGLDNPDLRKALAHAIDREAVLNAAFRHNLGPTVHKPLNGPFPVGSWAADPSLVFKPELARNRIQAAEAKGLKNLKLSLKYPNDPEIARAMEVLAKQVQDAIGVTLELAPRSLHDLRAEVETTHDYSLAYYWYDFTGPTYWLWPLFDPRGTAAGGTNYLGYQNDGALEAQFGMIMGRREFKEVQKLTHTLHGMLFDKMPLVPLWQLDSHLVQHDDLQATISDPLLVFTDVEQWRFDKK